MKQETKDRLKYLPIRLFTGLGVWTLLYTMLTLGNLSFIDDLRIACVIFCLYVMDATQLSRGDYLEEKIKKLEEDTIKC